MGCQEIKVHGRKRNKNEESNIKNENMELIKSDNDIKKKEINLDEPIKINNRIKECEILTSPFEPADTINKNVSKAICKIKIQVKSEIIFGSGFLFKTFIDQEYFYCLITCEHVISNDIILNNNNNINIYYDNQEKICNLTLDQNKKYIKTFKDINLDITVIEILEKDNIPKEYFIYNPYLDLDNIDYNELINNEIYIPQYPKGKDLVNARGKIIEIDKYEFTHLASTETGSSGSPIFLKDSINVIGIHKEGNNDKSENYGDFIYPIINIIKNDISRKRNKGIYIDGKYIYADGKYYKGQFVNNIPSGYGTKYYANGNILYDGYFIDDKYEGYGKEIWENGEYYIGQYHNGIKHGNGIEYYSNGKIRYDGFWINGKPEGRGKYIGPNGQYYIGQFKNGVSHGKGKEYYENGNLKFEGNFINGLPDGNGKYIWRDGTYYIGQFKQGLRHGKGKEYYPNGNMCYDAEYINDRLEGYGKYIGQDGGSYIGQYKNGLRHGEGIEFYPNGDIKYEGEWANGKIEGYGKYTWEDGFYYIGQTKNGSRNGKGIHYYPNGSICYDGEWANDKFEGNGRYIFTNGDYYIGQFRYGLKHGKGIYFYSNGEIKYEGEWNNDEFEDNNE